MGEIDGGELLIRMLERAGIREVFTLHDGHLDCVFMAARDHGFRVIDTRHEQAAAHAAEGWARSTGKPGVALVAAGPGITDAVTGVANAYVDAVPMLIISGGAPMRDAEMLQLQDGFDQVALLAPITKWSHRVTHTERIPDLVAQALRIATTGRPGPVYLEIPVDVIYARVDEARAFFPLGSACAEARRSDGRCQPGGRRADGDGSAPRHRHGARVLRRGTGLRARHLRQTANGHARRVRAGPGSRTRDSRARLLQRRAGRMVLSEPLPVPVPERLSAEKAALTEPMAVGVHAVAKSRASERDSAIVIGCGPVGLAVIAGLRLQNVEPIVAADFSPMRRKLAQLQGAHVVVDPNEGSAFAAWTELSRSRPPVVFECVGVPGVVQSIIKQAPRFTRIVVVGVSMEEDHFKPMIAIVKELSLQFCLGYSVEEFSQTLAAIADGSIDVEPMITGRVGLEAVADAFEELAQPDRHAKILIDPGAL